MPVLGRVVAALLLLLLAAPAALANCPGVISRANPLLNHASVGRSAVEKGELKLTFLGHASYLIETPGGIAAATDFNGMHVPAFPPDVITMNNTHRNHYMDNPDPRIPHVLRGWDPAGGVARHNLKVGDLVVRNLATNTRADIYGGGGTRRYGNSIFVFEAAEMCVAHLGHLHHPLTPEDLEDLGRIDVLILPVDGGATLSHEDAVTVVEQLRVPIVIPTHYFSEFTLERFLGKVAGRWPARRHPARAITLTRERIPTATEIVILPNY